MPSPNPADMTTQEILDEITVNVAKAREFRALAIKLHDMGEEVMAEQALNMEADVLDRILDLTAEWKARGVEE